MILSVNVTEATGRAFLEKLASEERTTSDVLRTLIDGYLERDTTPGAVAWRAGRASGYSEALHAIRLTIRKLGEPGDADVVAEALESVEDAEDWREDRGSG